MEIPDELVHNRSRFRSPGLVTDPFPDKTLSNPTIPMTALPHKVFRLERDGDVLIVVPQGDASGFRYNDVHQESNVTLQVLDDPTLKHVVVDFTSERILGSIIISVVIKTCRKAGTKGGKAAFCNASPEMLEVLQTMNLTKLWTHYSSRADAIAAVRTGSPAREHAAP